MMTHSLPQLISTIARYSSLSNLLPRSCANQNDDRGNQAEGSEQLLSISYKHDQ
jgi:hypothetical protein